MTERQKKRLAKTYHATYLRVIHGIRDVKTAAERENIDLVLWNARELHDAKVELDCKFSVLCDLRLGVKVTKDNEAVLIDFCDMSAEEADKSSYEFLNKKIILEGGEDNGES